MWTLLISRLWSSSPNMASHIGPHPHSFITQNLYRYHFFLFHISYVIHLVIVASPSFFFILILLTVFLHPLCLFLPSNFDYFRRIAAHTFEFSWLWFGDCHPIQRLFHSHLSIGSWSYRVFWFSSLSSPQSYQSFSRLHQQAVFFFSLSIYLSIFFFLQDSLSFLFIYLLLKQAKLIIPMDG